jgi:hypothetical protein
VKLNNQKLIRLSFNLLVLLFANVVFSQTIIEGYITDLKTSKGVFANVVLKDENGKNYNLYKYKKRRIF